jgi:hypothetical protein
MGLLSRIRPSPGIATTASAPRGGGGGRRPGGGGCWHIERRERPRKTRLLLLVVNRTFERSSGGVPLASLVPLCPGERDVGILNAETGEGAEEGARAWVYSPRRAFPRVSPRLPSAPRRGRRPEAGRGGGCRHIESRDRGGGFCPLPVCPTPQRRYLPRSSVWGGAEGGASAWVYSPRRAFPRVSPRLPPPLGAGVGARRAGRGGGGCRHMCARS